MVRRTVAFVTSLYLEPFSGWSEDAPETFSRASAQRSDVKLRAAGGRPTSSGAPLAAHPIMPVQVARRRANSRHGSRLGRREKQRRTVNFNAELARANTIARRVRLADPHRSFQKRAANWRILI